MARPVVFAALCFAFASLCQAKGWYLGSNPAEASVGNLHFKIHDDRLPIEEAIQNQTILLPDLSSLFGDVTNYWDNYTYSETPPIPEQVDNLTQRARADLNSNDYFSKYSDVLLNASREWADTYETEDILKQYELPVRDIVAPYLDAIANLSQATWWYTQGAYIGVGKSLYCSSYIDDVLSNKGEWDKMGSSAATTIMALLPTLLAFGNFYVARSSELYSTSAIVGLTSAFYTFGLPVKSISAVQGRNSVNTALFGIAALALIGKWGEKRKKDGTPEHHPPLATLQEWSSDHAVGDFSAIKQGFATVQENASKNWEKRWHMWQAPALLVSLAQTLVFAFLIYPIFRNLGVPKFIFSCDNSSRNPIDWTGLYIGVSAAVNTIVRYLMWEASNHERVKVYGLSVTAISALRLMISNGPGGETTETDFPPLQPPLLRRMGQAISGFKPSFSRKGKQPSARPHPGRPQPRHGLRSTISNTWDFLSWRLSYIFKNPMSFLSSGAGANAARRWRPIYILIHLSTASRNPILTLMTGFVEACLLLVLTFFFSAQWGGNLIITMIALSLLLVFITLGRALGLLYVCISTRVWGLTVINCDSVDEIRGTLRIVCSMKEVLVTVNGATYFEGYRMDDRPGWRGFLLRYERGELDLDHAGSLHPSGSSSSMPRIQPMQSNPKHYSQLRQVQIVQPRTPPGYGISPSIQYKTSPSISPLTSQASLSQFPLYMQSSNRTSHIPLQNIHDPTQLPIQPTSVYSPPNHIPTAPRATPAVLPPLTTNLYRHSLPTEYESANENEKRNPFSEYGYEQEYSPSRSDDEPFHYIDLQLGDDHDFDHIDKDNDLTPLAPGASFNFIRTPPEPQFEALNQRVPTAATPTTMHVGIDDHSDGDHSSHDPGTSWLSERGYHRVESGSGMQTIPRVPVGGRSGTRKSPEIKQQEKEDEDDEYDLWGPEGKKLRDEWMV